MHSARLTESAARAAGAQRQRERVKHGPFSGLRSRRGAVGRRSVRREVVVKVQRPGAKQLVLRDLATLHTFAKLVGRDVSWDVDMVMTEVMSRVEGEFDFQGEAAVQVPHMQGWSVLSDPVRFHECAQINIRLSSYFSKKLPVLTLPMTLDCQIAAVVVFPQGRNR